MSSAAAKRVTASAVNWARLLQHTSARQVDSIRAMRSKSDTLVTQVNSLPAELPAIDWAHFSKTVPTSGLVDAFRKEYEALKVAYPRDTEGWHELLDAQEKHFVSAMAKSNILLSGARDTAKEFLKALDEKVPPRDEWTMETVCLYFPGVLFDAENPDVNKIPNTPENNEAPNLNRNPGGGLLSKL